MWRVRAWWVRARERALIAVAWRLPRSVCLWATIRVGAHATTGRWGGQETPTVTLLEALDRWEVR